MKYPPGCRLRTTHWLYRVVQYYYCDDDDVAFELGFEVNLLLIELMNFLRVSVIAFHSFQIRKSYSHTTPIGLIPYTLIYGRVFPRLATFYAHQYTRTGVRRKTHDAVAFKATPNYFLAGNEKTRR